MLKILPFEHGPIYSTWSSHLIGAIEPTHSRRFIYNEKQASFSLYSSMRKSWRGKRGLKVKKVNNPITGQDRFEVPES